MDISFTGSSQVNLGRNGDVGFFSFGQNLNAKVCNLKNNSSKGCNFGKNQRLAWPLKSAFGFTLRASAIEAAEISKKASKITIKKPVDGVELYVGLPLDTVSKMHTMNQERAIAAGLKALKLLGVEGVELPVWWGIAEREVRGKYQWTGYLAVAEMVRKLGLKLHVSLCFHASKECKIPLPEWVSRIGKEKPDIFFTDRSGQHYKDCLSLAVDDVPVLDGKTPVEVYKDFCESFKSAFSPFMGSTITGISVGLGPDGELRYPSNHRPAKSNGCHGAGEFQCYGKYMLANLKKHAEKHENPLWGLAGPHDAPGYDQNPISSGFFMENGGSWETSYGDFFLSWYSSQLISHGHRILSLAASTFKDAPISVSGKVPLVHSWYLTRSHPSELMAGFYNTANRDGYKDIAEIFSNNSCKMILPGMDLSDEHEPLESHSSPESLFAQITSSCLKYGVEVSGQNTSVSGVSRGFEQIKNNLLDKNATVDLFTYQRMGAYFFSPDHFPSFAQFIRSLNQPTQRLDSLPVNHGDTVESLPDSNLHMQTA
ncbi:inactive beta-amylase 9-like [Sesamum indicum]|uniref:Beta-amylase n=1 Tax=Sesamum indicum TaxID=4182 RepID=A0A6I9SQI7_SESIN|nr:inactive beta-amylase 9-like [Sesamum indicum]